jgi:tetratricopeptide (TPR) repeat protein
LADLSERIQLLHSLRKFAEAEKLAREQIAQFPESSDAYAQLAMILSDMGPSRRREAYSAVKQALKYDAKSSFALTIHGWMLRRDGRLRDAERVLREAIKCNVLHFGARTELIGLQLDRSRVYDAKHLLEESLALAPDHADLLYLDCFIKSEYGDLEEARDRVVSCISQHPEDMRFYYTLGKIEESLGFRKPPHDPEKRDWYEKSLESFRTAARLNPSDRENRVAFKRLTRRVDRLRRGKRDLQQDGSDPPVRPVTVFVIVAVAVVVLMILVPYIPRNENLPPFESPEKLRKIERQKDEEARKRWEIMKTKATRL